MELTEALAWRGRTVRWRRLGSGPPVVFCHGTPWSSALWSPLAAALSGRVTAYLWDMPGYGVSSKRPEDAVALEVQGELLRDLVETWGLDRPHVVAHDIGGAVALRAHLLHGVELASLALVDVVALRPWGSPFFRLVREHADVFAQLPPPVHEGALRSYVATASHRGLSPDQLDRLVAPWLGEGQGAFYRQIAQADEAHTAVLEQRYADVRAPTYVVWGAEDAWIPVDRARRLAATIPGAELTVVEDAGHLVHLDQPETLAALLTAWVLRQTWTRGD